MFRGRLLLSLLVLFTFGVTYAQDMSACDSAPDYMAEGVAHMDAGDFEAALAAYSCAIEAAPDDYHPYARHIEAALMSGHYADILTDYTWLRAHVSQETRGPVGKIIAEYLDALETIPEDQRETSPEAARLYLFRGVSRWWEEILPFAVQDFERVLAVDPQNTAAYLLRGSAYVFMDEYELAEADFARAVELEPDNPHVYLMIAETYIEGGDYEGGIQPLNRSIELGLETSTTHVLLGDVLAAQDNREAAAAEYAMHVDAVVTETIDGDMLQPDETLTLVIDEGQAYRLPLELEAGQQVTIRADGSPKVVDPLILLLDVDGMPVNGNDDTGNLNAALSYVSDENGSYTLLVTTYLGAGSGEIEVTLTVA